MLKISLISVIFLVLFNNCESQLNNVRVRNHEDYIISVVQATISEVEKRGWSNLKIPDTVQPINETVFDLEALGTVIYTNGFLVSIQHVDIEQRTVQQVWSRTPVGVVELRANVRLHNVVVGFDVLVNLTAGNYRYTGTYRHPLVNFLFSIVKDTNEDTLTTSVTGTTPTSTAIVNFLPRDDITDVLTTLYARASTIPGVNAWGPDVFTPILDDVVRNRIQFPSVCYNCPA